MFVVTADQRGSRHGPDRVDALLGALADRPIEPVRPFERTTGDEIQGVLDDPRAALELSLWFARHGGWSVGIGAGPVREPLPASTRAGAGPAFERARTAVQRAKRDPQHLAIETVDGPADAEAVVRLVAAIAERRTAAGWQAIDLVGGGATQQEAADTLGVTKQAISQRLQVALWPQEQQVRPLAVRLLREADA